MSAGRIRINRAPVLTLWAAVVAERLGHDHGAALTLGKAVAGLNAQSKGRRLGIFEAPPARATQDAAGARRPKSADQVDLLGRSIPVMRTGDGVRATAKGKPIDPESVERYLELKFGEDLAAAKSAMAALAKARSPASLAGEAYALYEAFRPAVPKGEKGWGAKGELDLDRVRSLAAR
jgi:hypothetical protein